jgi:5-formyltetrahydrofolate cyclo-ligase
MSSGSKAELRATLLQHRRSLPLPEQQQRSAAICQHLQQWSPLMQAKTVLLYWPIRQEPDLTPLLALPKQWGLPRCESDRLYWHHWQGPGSLVKDAQGITSPHPDIPRLHPSQVDLLLVPAIAGDRRGFRLGYGGGYYDRLLSQTAWQAIPALGICHDFALLDNLPTDPWDRPLQGFCTEQGLRLCNNLVTQN